MVSVNLLEVGRRGSFVRVFRVESGVDKLHLLKSDHASVACPPMSSVPSVLFWYIGTVLSGRRLHRIALMRSQVTEPR